MSRHKSILRIAAISWAGLLSCAAGADEPSALSEPPSPPASFQATLRNGETVGVEQVRRAYLSSGTNQFVFVVPPGFRMDGSNPEKVILSDATYSCFLALRIAGPLPGKIRDLRADFCRDLLLQQHPGAKISDEFSQSAANYTGPAFDAKWEGPSGTTQFARVVFLPSPVGILEFSLLSKPDKFAEGKGLLNFLLLSFRSNESGTLDLPVYSDKS